MTTGRLRTGRRGEQLAAERLVASGWQLVAANWRCRLGEIDLVARDGDCLVFVEVRTRRSQTFGTPEESVGPRKQAKLRRLGEHYVTASGWSGPWRIDVVAIELAPDGQPRRLAHYVNAVGGR